MVIEDTHMRVLKYLKKGSINTFRLSSVLRIDRNKILSILKEFEKKQLIEFKSGIAKFLKSPIKIKKVSKRLAIKKTVSAPKKVIGHKVKRVIAERKPSVLNVLQAENKELRERLMEVEKTIKVLEQKASIPPKIIRRTIVKSIIKEVPVEKKEEKPKKFTLPKFNLNWIKNIQNLKVSEFLHRKINIEPKISFAGLNKNIQQLNIPEMLRKGI